MQINVINTLDKQYGNYTNVLGKEFFEKTINELDTGEVTELILDDVLSIIPMNKVTEAIQTVASKIAIGGTLIVKDIDAYEVCYRFGTRQLSLDDFNRIMADRKVTVTGIDIASLLNHLGFKTIKRRIDELSFMVQVQRPTT